MGLGSGQLHKSLTDVAPSVSNQYAPVNSGLLLAPFLSRGWVIKSHIKPRLNSDGKRIGKEWITLTHPDYRYANGDELTVEILNGNTGSNALLIMGGYGRAVCSNGLVIGDVVSGRFVHRGTSIYERLERRVEDIIYHLDDIKLSVDKLKSVELSNELEDTIIDSIVSKMFDSESDKRVVRSRITAFSRRKIKRVWRGEDTYRDAFTRLNVIQENIIRHGRLRYDTFETDVITGAQRATFNRHKRPVEGRLSALSINKIIAKAFLENISEVA